MEWTVLSRRCFPIRLSLQRSTMYRFELPIHGVVHHLFEAASDVSSPDFSVVAQNWLLFSSPYRDSVISLSCDHLQILQKTEKLYRENFCWYSGGRYVAVFLCRDGRLAAGCTIESSAYNPTVNCFQVVHGNRCEDRWR